MGAAVYLVSWRLNDETSPWLGSVELPQGGSVQIGRAPESDIRLDDSAVSRSHAVIMANDNGVEVADTGSANGTRLGESHVSHSNWAGDMPVRIGPFELHLSYQQPAAPPPLPEHSEPVPSYSMPPEFQAQPEPEYATGHPESGEYRPMDLSGPAHYYGASFEGERAHSIDARPRLLRGTDSLWTAAVHRRDAFADTVRHFLDRHDMSAQLVVSPRNDYPPRLTLDSWLPVRGDYGAGLDTRLRSSLEVEIGVKPFHDHKFEHKVKLLKAGRTYNLQLPEKVANFNERDLGEWVAFAINQGHPPRRKYNSLEILLYSFLPFLAFRNKLSRTFRNSYFRPRNFVYLLAIIAAVVAFATPAYQGNVKAIAGGVAIVLFAVLYFTRARETLDCTPPTPVETPRALTFWGSWDVVLPDLGREYSSVQPRIIQAISEDRPERFEVIEEEIPYWTPTGVEQRRRHVFQHRQCQVHVHVYNIGPDLFVGWDAFLNTNQWTDADFAVSSKRDGGRKVRFREIKPSTYDPTEFDWIDLRGLAEFVHRRIERIIKRLLKEREIDIDLDFKIVRSDIGNAGDKGKKKSGASDAKRVFQLFRR